MKRRGGKWVHNEKSRPKLGDEGEEPGRGIGTFSVGHLCLVMQNFMNFLAWNVSWRTMGAGCIVHCNKVSKPVKGKYLLLCMNSIMYFLLTSYTLIMFLKVLSLFIMRIKNFVKYFKEGVLKYFKMSTKFFNISKWNISSCTPTCAYLSFIFVFSCDACCWITAMMRSTAATRVCSDPTNFQCETVTGNRNCYSQYDVCDGVTDCDDSSDENRTICAARQCQVSDQIVKRRCRDRSFHRWYMYVKPLSGVG